MEPSHTNETDAAFSLKGGGGQALLTCARIPLIYYGMHCILLEQHHGIALVHQGKHSVEEGLVSTRCDHDVMAVQPVACRDLGAQCLQSCIQQEYHCCAGLPGCRTSQC